MWLDRCYWLVIFMLYSTIFYKLIRWGWWRFFPWLTAFMAQNVLTAPVLLYLFHFHYHDKSYRYAYAIGKALDIVTGMPSIHEVCRLPLIAWTLTVYFMLQLYVLSIAGPMHWYQAELLIKPVVIGFEVVWLWNLMDLKKNMDEEMEFR
jgi:hypothetical protein